MADEMGAQLQTHKEVCVKWSLYNCTEYSNLVLFLVIIIIISLACIWPHDETNSNSYSINIKFRLSPCTSQLEEIFPLSRSASRELQKVPSSPDLRHYTHAEASNKYTDDRSVTSESSLVSNLHFGEKDDFFHNFQVTIKT